MAAGSDVHAHHSNTRNPHATPANERPNLKRQNTAPVHPPKKPRALGEYLEDVSSGHLGLLSGGTVFSVYSCELTTHMYALKGPSVDY